MRIRLSEEFLSKYAELPAFPAISWVTYKRTYSRKVQERLEEWAETIRRVVEGNINLDPRLKTYKGRRLQALLQELTREAEELFDWFFWLAVLPPGRGMWMSGTLFSELTGDGLNNCLKGSERVFVKGAGLVPIKELAGHTVEVLSDGGVYRKAEFKSFGTQRLMKVVLSDAYSSSKQEVYATPDHEWVVLRGNSGERAERRVYTRDLVGQKVPVVRPDIPEQVDMEGVAHGYTFGDGTVVPQTGYCRVQYFDEDKGLFDVLSQFGSVADTKVPTVANLPGLWKRLPNIGEVSQEYLLGFLMGWIAADGNVRGNQVRLFCKNELHLQWATEIAQYLGLKVNPVRTMREDSPFDGSHKPLYSLTFSAETFPGHLLAIDKQREAWEPAKRVAQNPYKTVVAVEETGMEEEVFCCVEPETHSFVLEGHVLTGNCWFTAARPHVYAGQEKVVVSYPFVFLFDQSMKGGGVGFSVEDMNLEQIPDVRVPLNLVVVCDSEHANAEEVRSLKLYKDAQVTFMTPEQVERVYPDAPYRYVVDDSREGWGRSLGQLIDLHFDQTVGLGTTYIVDVSKIREKGAPIKGFGGVASGPAPLVELLVHVNFVLNRAWGGKLTSVDSTDIENLIGRCVVAGNVRRTAEVALGSPWDKAFVNMKNWQTVAHVVKGWTQDEETGKFEPILKSVAELVEDGLEPEQAERDYYTAWAQNNHRWASNNSVIVDEPSFFDSPDFAAIVKAIAVNGEPGIFNRYLAKNFGRITDGFQPDCDPDVEGGNPCMEISLAPNEPCNLFEVCIYNVFKQGRSEQRAVELGVRYAKRVTFSKYSWAESQRIVEQNRRLGISLTGIQDWILAKWGKDAITGYTTVVEEGVDGSPVTLNIPDYSAEVKKALDQMYQWVKAADKAYSADLGVDESIKVTTVKPSGTISLVAGGLSPGMHFHYFRYGIRRIRFDENSALVPMLKLCGFKVEPDKKAPRSVVVEFPFKAPTADIEGFKSCDDVTIEEQFAAQSLLQEWWADNMVSCTITFKPEEVDKIGPLLRMYRDRLKATSLLPYSGHGYEQAPYEPTSQEKYEAMVARIKVEPQVAYALTNISGDIGSLDDSQECENGACPVR